MVYQRYIKDISMIADSYIKSSFWSMTWYTEGKLQRNPKISSYILHGVLKDKFNGKLQVLIYSTLRVLGSDLLFWRWLRHLFSTENILSQKTFVENTHTPIVFEVHSMLNHRLYRACNAP